MTSSNTGADRTGSAEGLPAEAALDEGSRPRAPRIAGATEAHRRRGRHLADVHRMYLAEIEQVGRLIARVEAGERDAAELAGTVAGLEMARNYRVVGTLCGRECQVLTLHHHLESLHMFPVLADRGDAGLRAVVARLQAEHEVVHALILRLEEATAALMDAPSPWTFAAARDAFAALERAVRSHFAYEETELEEALGYHGIV